jgi:RimJ/RimL family protein N-acetyltransferase
MNFWQTNTIRLRAIEPTDAETFYRWNLDSERARNLDFVWPPSSLASVQAWAEEASKQKMDGDHFHWVIETPNQTPVGTISTHDCNPHTGTLSYGVDIEEAHRGKGYAGQAIWLVLRWYFDELRYQKVTVQVHANNPASMRLHDKLGFQREGVIRRAMFECGQYTDVVYFDLTVEEFHALDQERKQES